MGRKRKSIATASPTADEVKTSPSQAENSTPVEDTNVEKNSQPNSDILQTIERTPTLTNTLVRRSGRAKTPVTYSKRRGPKVVVEHVTLDENEKEEEEEAPMSENVNNNNALPVVNLEVEKQVPSEVDERSLEEKVIEKANDDSSSDTKYKILVSQLEKKNEELMEETYELVRKLEFAHGQISAYEKMVDAMGVLKEVILLSGLGNPTKDDNVSLQTPAFEKRLTSPPAAADGNTNQTKRSYKKKKATDT